MGVTRRDRILKAIIGGGTPEQLADKIEGMFSRKKKVADPCFQDFVRVWCEAYPIIGFKRGAQSGRAINEIIQDTKKVMVQYGADPTDCKKVVASFEYVIAYVKKANHWVNNKGLTKWSSEYLSILTEIKAGKPMAAAIKANSSQIFGRYGN